MKEMKVDKKEIKHFESKCAKYPIVILAIVGGTSLDEFNMIGYCMNNIKDMKTRKSLFEFASEEIKEGLNIIYKKIKQEEK